MSQEIQPIIYISGGLLGDFIHQLSVINEMFINTNRKGILYINNFKDCPFRYEISKTYKDTYKLVTEQNYILEYKIYNNEKYDINLSSWRYSNLLYKTTWDKIFIDTYKISWGINKWINVGKDDKWKDMILINKSSYRDCNNINFSYINEKYGNKTKFVCFNIEEYNNFCNTFNIYNIELCQLDNLYDLCVAINSCKLFIGNLSSPLAFAYALHKKSIVGIPLNIPDSIFHRGLEVVIPNLIINDNPDEIIKKIDELCIE